MAGAEQLGEQSCSDPWQQACDRVVTVLIWVGARCVTGWSVTVLIWVGARCVTGWSLY